MVSAASACATSCARSPSKSTTATRAPSRANRSHTACPMPDAPPVTTATRPPSSADMSLLVSCRVLDELGDSGRHGFPTGREMLGGPEARCGLVALQHLAGDGDLVDLRRPIGDAQHLGLDEHVGK